MNNLFELNSSELNNTNGGGFAYSAGRAIRFTVFAVWNPSMALADWDVSSNVNDAVNS